MKRKVFETVEVICILFSLIIGVFGAAWCEETGRIDILAVSVGLMMMAWLADSIRKRCRRTTRMHRCKR